MLNDAGDHVLRPVSSHGRPMFWVARHHPSGAHCMSRGSSMGLAMGVDQALPSQTRCARCDSMTHRERLEQSSR